MLTWLVAYLVVSALAAALFLASCAVGGRSDG